MREQIREILNDTLTVTGSDAIRGHEECIDQIMQLILSKLMWQASGSLMDSLTGMIKNGFTLQQIREEKAKILSNI